MKKETDNNKKETDNSKTVPKQGSVMNPPTLSMQRRISLFMTIVVSLTFFLKENEPSSIRMVSKESH